MIFTLSAGSKAPWRQMVLRPNTAQQMKSLDQFPALSKLQREWCTRLVARLLHNRPFKAQKSRVVVERWSIAPSPRLPSFLLFKFFWFCAAELWLSNYRWAVFHLFCVLYESSKSWRVGYLFFWQGKEKKWRQTSQCIICHVMMSPLLPDRCSLLGCFDPDEFVTFQTISKLPHRLLGVSVVSLFW